MTNCFFKSIHQAFQPQDFYAHFPREDDEKLPPGLFQPYWASLSSFVSLLYTLADFLQTMYGYTRMNDGIGDEKHKNQTMYLVSCHVLINSTKVDDRELGECLHALIQKEVTLEKMLQNGYYDGCPGFDPYLILLCEFTGIQIHVHLQGVTKPFIYRRLNTPIRSIVHLKFTKGHVSFQKRENKAKLKPRKRKLNS